MQKAAAGVADVVSRLIGSIDERCRTVLGRLADWLSGYKPLLVLPVLLGIFCDSP